MKKFLVVFLTLAIISTVLIACSKAESNDNTSVDSTVEQIATEEAKIKENDALNFIKTAYTTKELGLDTTDKDYQFMIASNGVEIDGENYVKVVANVLNQNDTTAEDEKVTYSMDTLGEYYISFDGKTVLMKDLETDEYKELENRYEEYKAKNDTIADGTTAK